jgi:hypothetical protein
MPGPLLQISKAFQYGSTHAGNCYMQIQSCFIRVQFVSISG